MQIEPGFALAFIVPVAAWLLAWGIAMGMAWAMKVRALHPLTLLDDSGHHSEYEEKQR